MGTGAHQDLPGDAFSVWKSRTDMNVISLDVWADFNEFIAEIVSAPGTALCWWRNRLTHYLSIIELIQSNYSSNRTQSQAKRGQYNARLW